MIIPVQNLPGLPKLTADYLSTSKADKFFNGHFRSFDDVRQVSQKITGQRPFTNELMQLLTRQNRSFHCGQKTLDHIALLGNPETRVVVTGQQAGLFTGPLYTIYKALTTIKLAQDLTDKLKTPVLPVFYLVTEDHDYEEVRWCGYIGKDNHYKTAVYNARPGERMPVSTLILEESITTLINSFAQDQHPTEFKDQIVDSLKSCYTPGAGFHTAFSCWFSKLFEKFGIILFDSSDPEYKPWVMSVFEKELRERTTIHAIEKTNQELAAMDYHQQLTVQPKRPNLFLLENGRHSLEWNGKNYINMNSGKEYPIEELLQTPAKLSPKAALRPLVQDTLFPTIAYVGGPGEISYWAQLKGIYQAMNMIMPIVWPRAGFTLLGPKVRRHLQKFSIVPENFILHSETAVEQIKTGLIPRDIKNQFDTIKTGLDDSLNKIKAVVLPVEPVLQQVFEKSQNNIISQLQQLEAKVYKGFEQREGIVMEQLGALSAELLPENTLQERKLNIVPFLIKYNYALLDKLYSLINTEKIEHQIVEL